MKKIMSAIISMVLLLVLFQSAIAEEFVMRNGVQFGMTLAEIEQLETLPRDKDRTLIYFYGYGEIAGIKNSAVEYHFDKDGGLQCLEIDFDAKKTRKQTLTESDYQEINSMLTDKYGQPLGNTKGAAHYLHGKEFDGFISSYSTWTKLGSTLIYDEWLLEQEDGSIIKIDHLALLSKTSCSHILEYSFFSTNDMDNKKNDI